MKPIKEPRRTVCLDRVRQAFSKALPSDISNEELEKLTNKAIDQIIQTINDRD